MRPDTIPSSKPALFAFMTCQDFTDEELQAALKSLKKRKSAGDDDVPAEFWQVCLDSQKN